MKAATFTLLALSILTLAATTAAAQNQVFVPGNASGFFGWPADIQVPLIPAITVSGPNWITVTYVSGTICDGGGGCDIGPNGVKWEMPGQQSPLQEAKGISGGTISNLDSLIGVFVPQKTVQKKGFNPLDGTKCVTRVGIMPNGLFFIGTGKKVWAGQAGTLFLGINDWIVSDNSGGFNVTVSAQ